MVIGRGAYGKVILSRFKNSEKLYAVKCLKKHMLIEQSIIEHTLNEKNIMLEIDHPFIVGMDYVFQNE